MNVSSDEVKASLEALTNALEKQKRNFDKYDKILMRHGAKLESLETFDRSQYSCNKFILQKLTTNEDRIDNIASVLEQIYSKLDNHSCSSTSQSTTNPSFQGGEDIEESTLSNGKISVSLNI